MELTNSLMPGEQAGVPGGQVQTADDVVLNALESGAQETQTATSYLSHDLVLDKNAVVDPTTNSLQVASAVRNADQAMVAIPIVLNNAVKSTVAIADNTIDLLENSRQQMDQLQLASKGLTDLQNKRAMQVDALIEQTIPELQANQQKAAAAAQATLDIATRKQNKLNELSNTAMNSEKPILERFVAGLGVTLNRKNVQKAAATAQQYANTVTANQQLINNSMNMVLNREKIRVNPAEMELQSNITFIKQNLEMNKENINFNKEFGAQIGELNKMLVTSLNSWQDMEAAKLRSQQLRLSIANAGMQNRLMKMNLDEATQTEAYWNTMAPVLGVQNAVQAKQLYASLPDMQKSIVTDALRQYSNTGTVDLSNQLVGMSAVERQEVLPALNKILPRWVPQQTIEDLDTLESRSAALMATGDKKTQDLIKAKQAEIAMNPDKKAGQAQFQSWLRQEAGKLITNGTMATSNLNSNYGMKNAQALGETELAQAGLRPDQIAKLNSVQAKTDPQAFLQEAISKMKPTPETYQAVSKYFMALRDKNNELGRPDVVGLPPQRGFEIEVESFSGSLFGGTLNKKRLPIDLTTPAGVQTYVNNLRANLKAQERKINQDASTTTNISNMGGQFGNFRQTPSSGGGAAPATPPNGAQQ